MLPDQTFYNNILREPTQTNINERAKYTANTGMALVSTANVNLDGTGTIATVLTAATTNTQIKSVNIKAIGDTTEGMIRFYAYDGTNYFLIDEIKVPPSKKSGTYPAFERSFDLEYSLKADYSLRASTQNGESFIITVEALDWTY